jgi:TRAP-type mannitol/chloroaromatic compound transport system permease small subunit
MKVSSPTLTYILLVIFGLTLAYILNRYRKNKSLQTVLYSIDEVSVFIGKFFGWAILILTIAMSYEVMMRYAFNKPTSWAFDVSYILYGFLFMCAGPYALSRNAHVRGDFIYRSWSVKKQAWFDFILYIIFFFPGIFALCYAGYSFASFSWMIFEHSSNSPNGPPLYHFKSLIPIVGGFMVLQGFAEVVRCIQAIQTGEWPSRLSDVEETEKLILEQAEKAAA